MIGIERSSGAVCLSGTVYPRKLEDKVKVALTLSVSLFIQPLQIWPGYVADPHPYLLEPLRGS
jgi:hypothetical protein